MPWTVWAGGIGSRFRRKKNYGSFGETMKPEYVEGIKARENFEQGMKAVFKVRKADVVVKRERNAKRQRAATVRKTKRSDKD
jgi:hypothetical protein